ncbi:MAG: CCA tRNA nucleotidyltransferase [Bacillota bacterium]
MKLSLRARASVLRITFRWQCPPEIRQVMRTLLARGFQAYAVGGSVRDLLLGRPPKDWDVATDALPDRVRGLFPRTVATGMAHGTITVLSGDRQVEVTTFRVESSYSDRRHPDAVRYVRRLADDLARRDFTINALAADASGRLVDLFGGIDHLERRWVAAVGEPGERFGEDALRMMRAVRIASELGFDIERNTYRAIRENASKLQHISIERIRDEFRRIVVSPHPRIGLERLRETGLLAEFLPELLEGYDFPQNRHHRYTVWEHNLIAMESVPPELELRLAALLHDVGKPRSLSVDEEGERHFFNHEIIGADLAYHILKRLKFEKTTVSRVVHLVRYHMALHLAPDMKDAAIRRLIRRVGLENMDTLLRLREADRRASGKKPGPVSRGTLELLRRIDRILKEDAAFGLKDLAVNGNDIMEATGLKPGPMVGRLLSQLLEAVLEDPKVNQKETLIALARERLAALPDSVSGEEDHG